MYELRVEYYILDALIRKIKIRYNENLSYTDSKRIRDRFLLDKILVQIDSHYNLTPKGKEYYNMLQKELGLNKLDKVIHPDILSLFKPISKNTIYISKKERS